MTDEEAEALLPVVQELLDAVHERDDIQVRGILSTYDVNALVVVLAEFTNITLQGLRQKMASDFQGAEILYLDLVETKQKYKELQHIVDSHVCRKRA